MKELFSPEILAGLESVLPYALVAFGMAFTALQREWIRRRDEYKCQAPVPHDCNGSEKIPIPKRKLQVHHVLPQRYCKAVGIRNPDFAENGITLCENFHQGTVHPDMKEAKVKYRVDPESYHKAFNLREEQIKNKKVYWCTLFDRQMHVIAVRNTQRKMAEGMEEFPAKKR